jgi:hypothetical protein
MLSTVLSNQKHKRFAFLAGTFFLFFYWLLGFDGITFSDDVYYLLVGKSFWEGTMEVNAYHFSSRWGAYVPSGSVGLLLGFDPHKISLISLVSYAGTLWLLIRLLPKKSDPWILTLWLTTQVYFLHFLTKVYPDSLLVFWTVLIPYSASHRRENPILAALGVILGLLFGFITKETIVFLGLLPIFLFGLDLKKRVLSIPFYLSLIIFGMLAGIAYLGFFWWYFGDPFYRVSSINAGHYISEFTYADKGIWSILRRITYLPILTFVERAFWIWIVMAIPGVYIAWKKRFSPGVEMSLAFVCLVFGFWLMSSTLEFYNPIYLNPRHLIILVPIMAFLIALGWNELWTNRKLFLLILSLIGLGVLISVVQQDWKMSTYQLAFLLVLFFQKIPHRTLVIGILLLIPAIASLFYQNRIKGYPEFQKALEAEVLITDTPILINNFIHFSREVLLPEEEKAQKLLLPIEKLDSLKPYLPNQIRVFIYEYYLHAYPKEQEDVAKLEEWLNQEYRILETRQQGLVNVRVFEKLD